MSRVNPITLDESIMADTVREMLDDPRLHEPLEVHYLMDCLQMLPFNITIYLDKIYGRWVVTNMGLDHIRENSSTEFSGPNFTAIENNLELALAKSIHYYYHSKMRD